MDDLLAMLTELGFGEYEARAYIALLEHSPVNGYELAQQSGVPRGSIYAALARLEEKGAAVRVEVPTGTRYAPVPAEEVLSRAAARFNGTLGRLRSRLAGLVAPPEAGYVWTARGYDALLEHARGLAGAAQESLALATWPQEAAALNSEIADACARGVQLRTLCLANCAQECGHCRGHIYRYDVQLEPEKRWLLLVPDGREALAGEISPAATTGEVTAASAVRTRQRLLVGLAEAFICQSTALAAILAGLASDLAPVLSSEAREVLASLGAGGGAGGWSAHMRLLLAQGGLLPGPDKGQDGTRKRD